MTDETKKNRREEMKKRYLALARKAEEEGYEDVAAKMRLAAKRCDND